MKVSRAAPLVAALVAACGGESTSASDGAAAAVPVAAEDAVRVERGPIRAGPRIAGSLEARQRADMRAEVGGRVLEMHVELGQRVERGQLLARIESSGQGDALRSARAQVRSARENLAVAQRQTHRTDALVRAGALAERDLETARSQAVAADAALGQAIAQEASARTQLANATLRAPMSGVVSQAPVHAGDVVAVGSPLVTIIDPSSMRLEASVPAADLRAAAVDTPVVFSVRGYPQQTFQGVVERVAPAADPITRQIAILVRIPNERGTLVAGLFAEGRLVGAQRQALVVPAAAIDTSAESPTATRVRRGVVEKVNVLIGLKDAASERVEVQSGLSAGDVVLLRNARALPPGTRVAVNRPGEAAPARAAPGQPPPASAKPSAGGGR